MALALLAFLLVVRAERDVGEDTATIRAAEQALAAGKAHRVRTATLQAIAQRAQGRATVAIASDRAKDAEMRRLRVQLALDATDSARVVTLTRMVDTLTAQRDSARAAIGALLVRVVADSTRAWLAERRADSLEVHLRRVLTIADCRIAGIRWAPRCPSRTTSAILGVATGAVAVVLAR